MNIREQLQLEHSKTQSIKIAEFACESNENFKELMTCFLDNNSSIAQRAAWSVSWAARKKPEMIAAYIGVLVAQLSRKDVHNAVIRNSVRILEDVEIPEEFHGAVINACFGFIENPSTPIAIKAFSLTCLFNLCKFYPEIQNELKLIIEDRMDNETAAFRSRSKKILSKLEN